MKKYDLYIFDMDGTLIDTSPGIIKSVCHTLKAFDKAIPDDEILTSFIGPPLKKSFALLPDVAEDEAEEMVKVFRREYRGKEILNAKLYEGIISLCGKLCEDGAKLAVATNKPTPFAQKLASHFHLEQFIPVICGADMNGLLKKTDLIRKAMELSKEPNEEKTVMIGDTAGDAEAAAECGVDFIGVSYGFGIWESSRYPNMVKIADKPADIY